MTKDEALKLALEAIEGVLDDSPKVLEASITGGLYEVVQCRDAITAIKEALAQPEQEPVAWIYKGEKSFDGNKYSDEYELTASKQVALWKDKNAKPLYTTPQQRKPLSDEEAQQTFAKHNCTISTHLAGILARAIEAKLKEKNT